MKVKQLKKITKQVEMCCNIFKGNDRIGVHYIRVVTCLNDPPSACEISASLQPLIDHGYGSYFNSSYVIRICKLQQNHTHHV